MEKSVNTKRQEWLDYLISRFTDDRKNRACSGESEWLWDSEKLTRMKELARLHEGVRVLPTYIDPQLPENVREFLRRDGLVNHLEAALIDDNRTIFVPDCYPKKLENMADALGKLYKPDNAPIFTYYERAANRLVIEIATCVPVFVYGTLMRGELRHEYLSSAQFEGADAIEDCALLDAGEFPVLMRRGAGRVHGELYSVPAPSFWRLDRIEGHPVLYRRHWLKLSSGRTAWVYTGGDKFAADLPEIESGSWRSAREERWS